ncbi:Membrane-associated phospholipid phosphatase [Abditibacterium utsteinense]|uniref:Membrane-associated phospholipid phosphatase n=1 Tax=Abditibacterium utsteinense TaxID=1960156 RepID=A0A2S8SQB9_9BACT|nr:phosphatase PAP2 family protein [Abditibacterium utsteinense]PQV62997.1 Membrane-associated phospholipid phosphatase [Abditibacterium utsteinense]
MQLFLFLNGLAGRFPFLDECARWFYIGAVPLLAILFLAQLLLAPREDSGEIDANGVRLRIAIAVVSSLLLVAFIGLASEYFAGYLHLGTLSPRPFMTRRVNLLIVEPQDNSFPSFEMALAAIFAVGLAFSSQKLGVLGAIAVVLLGVTRLFCGSNYLADVAVGALLGTGICAAMGAILRTELRVFESRRAWQFGAGSVATLVTLAGSYISLASTPRFSAKLPLFGSSATASTSGLELAAPRKAARAASGAITEGEGSAEGASESAMGAGAELSAEELALSKRSHLFLPEVEKFLRGKLTPIARPFKLLDVEVAPVTTEKRPYRCAAIRFEIPKSGRNLRLQTAEIAARIVKAAYANDSQLQNVDITAILRGDGAQIDGSSVHFAGDEVPVFTASIARENLIVKAPRWANDPKLDGGSWLRTRSRLYINDKVLVATMPQSGAAIPRPTARAMPQKIKTPTNKVAPTTVAPIRTG